MTPDDVRVRALVEAHGMAWQPEHAFYRAISQALQDEREQTATRILTLIHKKTHEPWVSDAIKRAGESLIFAIRTNMKLR